MIKEIIINYLPAFVLGFIFIFCTFKYIGKFNDMADTIKSSSTYTRLEDHMKQLLNENYDIKKDNKELKKELEETKELLKQIAEEYELKLEHKED
jgi:uncharacterized protein YlxW (UPF0749 family)